MLRDWLTLHNENCSTTISQCFEIPCLYWWQRTHVRDGNQLLEIGKEPRVWSGILKLLETCIMKRVVVEIHFSKYVVSVDVQRKEVCIKTNSSYSTKKLKINGGIYIKEKEDNAKMDVTKMNLACKFVWRNKHHWWHIHVHVILCLSITINISS